MVHDFVYHGKQLDSTAAVLTMATEAIGIRIIPHLHCLTSRPFSLKCPLIVPDMWFAPFVSPLDGLITALNTLRVSYKFQAINLSTPPGTKYSFGTLNHWLQNGPVILGPLDRTQLWDRMEARYYRGAAYFVLVLKGKSDGLYWIHDPEGCPYRLVSQEKILLAIRNEKHKSGFLQIRSISEVRSREEIFYHTFLKGAKTRFLAGTRPEGNGRGIRSLSQELELRRLKSSEESALNFALPSLGLSLKRVAEFIADTPRDFEKLFPNWEMIKLQLLDVLVEYGIDCAYALDELKKYNQTGLYYRFLEMAQKEDVLDDLFLKACRDHNY